MQEANIRLAIENHIKLAQNKACCVGQIIWENYKQINAQNNTDNCTKLEADKTYWYGKWFPSQPVRTGFDCVEYRGFYELLLSYPLNGCGPRDADLGSQCIIEHFECFKSYTYKDKSSNCTTNIRVEIPYRLSATEDRNRYEIIVRIPYKACKCKC